MGQTAASTLTITSMQDFVDLYLDEEEILRAEDLNDAYEMAIKKFISLSDLNDADYEELTSSLIASGKSKSENEAHSLIERINTECITQQILSRNSTR